MLALTQNPYKNMTYSVPSQLKSMFRVVSLLEPDIEMILRVKCVQFGIKGSNVLATRLKTIYDICQGSLMSLQSKFQLTLSNFISILRLAYEKQKTTVDSRPNSFITTNPSANKYGAAKLDSKIKLTFLLY